MSANTAEGELKLIHGVLYAVRDGNVYKYDDLAEKAGAFVGHLTEDGEGIVIDIEELLSLREQVSQLRVLLGKAEEGRQTDIARAVEAEKRAARFKAQRDAAVQKIMAARAALG